MNSAGPEPRGARDGAAVADPRPADGAATSATSDISEVSVSTSSRRITVGRRRPTGSPGPKTDATPDRLPDDGPEAAGADRLDVLLVDRGDARSRGHARDLVDAGHVRVAGRVARRASMRVPVGASVDVTAEDTYVGRAAHKLVAAMEAFGPAGPAVSGRRCLDVGACTGGFTQVLLERGARSVDALDVGHGQLAPAVADDPRVTERSGVNLRGVAPGDLGEPFDLVVGDLSFISLRLVLPVLAEQLAAGGDAVLLVKPQFEVGRERLGKAGIVRSSELRLAAVRQVVAAAREVGWSVRDVAASPLPGGTGNREYLVWFTASDAPAPLAWELDERISRLDDDPAGPERRDTGRSAAADDMNATDDAGAGMRSGDEGEGT